MLPAPLQHEISMFPNVKEATATITTVGNFLFELPEQYWQQVANVRGIPKESRAEAKKLLPAATISGQFHGRRAAAEISEYNGLVCIDIDEGDNQEQTPEGIKMELAQYPEVAYAGLSVGGRGVFCIIQTNLTNPADHPEVCDFLRNVFLEAGIYTDPSCRDVSRLRFISYDPDPFINPQPVIFDAMGFLAEVREQKRAQARAYKQAVATGGVAYRVEQLVQAIEARGADITDDYKDWTRLGFCLANEFGTEGEGFYQRISQFHPKYDPVKTSAKYAELLKNGGSRVNIGTLFYIAKTHNVTLK